MPAQVEQTQQEQTARAVINAIRAMVDDSLSGEGDTDSAVASILISLTMQAPVETSPGEQKVRAVINALWVIINANIPEYAGVARILILELCAYAAFGEDYCDFVSHHRGIQAADAASERFSSNRGVCAASGELLEILSQHH